MQNQVSYKPNRKMTAVGVSGATALVIVWVLSQFGIDMPMEVATASTVVIAWVAGYWIKESKNG